MALIPVADGDWKSNIADALTATEKQAVSRALGAQSGDVIVLSTGDFDPAVGCAEP